jgi:hypothetical protein
VCLTNLTARPQKEPARLTTCRFVSQAAAGGNATEHLDAIQLAAEKRSRKLMMNLKRELGAMFNKSNVRMQPSSMQQLERVL